VPNARNLARERCDHCKKWVNARHPLYTLEGTVSTDIPIVHSICGKCSSQHENDSAYWDAWVLKAMADETAYWDAWVLRAIADETPEAPPE
jgi:hypothetical protein